MLHLLTDAGTPRTDSSLQSTGSDEYTRSDKNIRRQIREDVAVVVRGEYQALHLLFVEGMQRMEEVQRESQNRQAELIARKLCAAIGNQTSLAGMGSGFDSCRVPKPEPACDETPSVTSLESITPVCTGGSSTPKDYFPAVAQPTKTVASTCADDTKDYLTVVAQPNKTVAATCADEAPHQMGDPLKLLEEKERPSPKGSDQGGVQALAAASGWVLPETEDEKDKKRLHSLRSTEITDSSGWCWYAKRAKLLEIVLNPWFDHISGIAIFANSIFMGIKTQVLLSKARSGDVSPEVGIEVFEALFTLIFVSEWLMRLGAYQRLFFSTKERGWHAFDTLLIVSGVLELLLKLGSSDSRSILSGGETMMLRVMRIFRLMRLLRIIRFVSAFRELRLLISGLLGSWKSLGWSMVFLLLLVYVFGIFFEQGVLQFLAQGRSEEVPPVLRDEVLEYFGSMEITMVTMFAAISGGTDWMTVMRPLGEISGLYVVAFIAYIMITYHGILHVIVGIFVDSTMTASRNDKDLVIAEEMSRKDSYFAQMAEVFRETDVDGSGTISWQEFEHKLQDARILAYFAALELDLAEAKGLFNLLDTEETNNVPIEEFVMGCFRLKGGAKGIDLAALMYENKKMTKVLKHFMNTTQDHFTTIDKRLMQLDDGTIKRVHC